MQCLGRHKSRTQTLGVTGEQRSKTDVRQAKEEHDNTVQAKTTTGVRRATLAESVEVVLEALLVRLEALSAHRLLQLLDIVDTLGTGHDLLTTHEEVVGVGETLVVGVGLGVERTNSHGEFVKDVEVGVVLLADDLAKLLLHGGGEVVLEALELGDVDAGLLKKGNTVHVVQAQGLAVLGQLEVTGLGVGLLDGGDLGSVALLELGKDEDKEVFGKVQNFMVVTTEGLLEIETGELYLKLVFMSVSIPSSILPLSSDGECCCPLHGTRGRFRKRYPYHQRYTSACKAGGSERGRRCA